MMHHNASKLTGVKMPPDDIGLCGTCSSSLVVHQGNKITVQCRAVGNIAVILSSGGRARRSDFVTERVDHCNMYHHVNTPSVHDMEQVAWTLHTEKDGRKIGFTPPERKER